MKLRELKIEITNCCPLNCLHCSTGSEGGLKSILFQPEIERIVDQAYELGCRKILFSGGEPLTHPHLDTLIEVCHRRGLKTKLYSCGIESIGSLQPVSFEKLKYLKAKGLDEVAFSLYSSRAKIHDQITDTPGSFVETVNAIDNSLRAGVAAEVHFVATKKNITELGQLSDFVLSIGIRHISVLRFVPQGRGRGNSGQLIPTSHDFGVLRASIAAIRQTSHVKLRLGSPFNFLLLGYPSICTTGTDRMIIDANGLAHPCDALKQIATQDRCNDTRTASLIQIMDVDSLFKTTRDTCSPTPCKSCPHFNICRGGCPAQRIMANGSLGGGRDPGCLRDELPISMLTT